MNAESLRGSGGGIGALIGLVVSPYVLPDGDVIQRGIVGVVFGALLHFILQHTFKWLNTTRLYRRLLDDSFERYRRSWRACESRSRDDCK
jgi:hypothetical protein